MVNSVFLSLPTFYMGKVKLPPTMVKQVDRYRKYCMWRGSDVNAKKPPLAAWSLATRSKLEGGLGILNITTHNDALLLKNLHKFFNRADCPWVQLIWDNYYFSGKLPDNRPKSSFWWRGVLKQLDKFKGIVMDHLNSMAGFVEWKCQKLTIPITLFIHYKNCNISRRNHGIRLSK
jgi:hypothetical protein